MRDLLNASWKLLVIRGVVAVIFGIVAMVWPDLTTITLVVLWGVWALVDGIGLAVSAFGVDEPTAVRVISIVMALIALGASFFAIVHPTDALKTLTWILGLWLIIRGLFDLAVGVFGSTSLTPRWLFFLTGALDLLIGILFVSHPGKSALGLAVLLGALALVWGVVLLFTGLMLRRDVRFYDSRQPTL